MVRRSGATALVVLLFASCSAGSTCRVRPVTEASHSIEATVLTVYSLSLPDPPRSMEPQGDPREFVEEGVALDLVRAFPFMHASEIPEAPDSVDEGPVDLGYPFWVDFGAGEAPYDDGMTSANGTRPGPSGFSDALMQLSWRQPLGGNWQLSATAAIERLQDLAILDGIEESSFAWAVVGFGVSF